MKKMLIVMAIVASGVNAFAAPSGSSIMPLGALTAKCTEPAAPPFSGLMPDATGGGYNCKKAVIESGPKAACLGTKNVSAKQNYCLWVVAVNFGTTMNSIAKVGDDGNVGVDIGMNVNWKKLSKCGELTVTVPATVKESKLSDGTDACAPALADVKAALNLKDITLCRDGNAFDYDGDLSSMISALKPGCNILSGNMDVQVNYKCNASSLSSVAECFGKAVGDTVKRMVPKAVQEVCNAAGNKVEWMLNNLSRIPHPPQPANCATVKLSKFNYEASISPAELLAVPKPCAPMLNQKPLVPVNFLGMYEPFTIAPGVNDDSCNYVGSIQTDFKEGHGAVFAQ